MLCLLARLNTCPITPAYAPHLHRYEQVGRIAGTWILGPDANPTDDEEDDSFRACNVDHTEIPALIHAARGLHAQVAAQPQGLLHQDFLPNNLGWRAEREEMVVFDLHKNARGPRFADVAPYLGLPDWSDSSLYLDHREDGVGSRRERLAQHYLSEYARFGGPVVSPQTFWDETAALSWSHKVAALPWLAEQKLHARIREVLEFLREEGQSRRAK
jgi:aminoglycoside phosphotransferase (APT) family kinase protein